MASSSRSAVAGSKDLLVAKQWAVHQPLTSRRAACSASTKPADAPTLRSQQKGSLRLFLDSADTQKWEHWQTGCLYGFTTNPAILEKDGVPCTLPAIKQLVHKAHTLQVQELQVQSWGPTAAAMEATACKILDLDADLITVKLPCTYDGLTAAGSLLAQLPNTSVTITGVYTPHQVLLAQAIGADYVAPYLGRMSDGDLSGLLQSNSAFAFQQQHTDDEKADAGGCSSYGGMDRSLRGMEVAVQSVLSMQAAVAASRSSMRILVASIRAASQMAILAAHGCDTFTFSPEVMSELMTVPQTVQAAAQFEAAAARNSRAPS